MARSQAIPVLVGADNSKVALERVRLGAGLHDENWLQDLIHHHPEIIPMGDIEPGLGELVAAAREIPCRHGFIDNLYITPVGDIVLVETKLWRNAQMRREVVAQALDYVAALTAMDYDTFEAIVTKAQHGPQRLYDLVADHPEALHEPDFIDAVSLNLMRGRMVVLVLGDGIRRETEALSSLLQSHAGAHFTFALVELAAWRKANDDILAVPNTLAKTVMIERGIVRIEDGKVEIDPAPVEARPKPQSITMSDFLEKMAERQAGLPAAIGAFLDAIEPLGVYPDLKSSLNIKIDLPEREKPVNFGYIQKNGQLKTNPISWFGTPERVWRSYNETLAALIDGQAVTGEENYVSVDGKSAPRIEQLLPAHHHAWVAAIKRVIQDLSEQVD